MSMKRSDTSRSSDHSSTQYSFYNKDFSGSVFERFNEILDLFPEFVRPKMIETFMKKK